MTKTFTALLLFIASGVAFAQDPHFSQFHQAPLFYNPALAGSEQQTRLLLNYRDQWRSVGVPFTTTLFSVDGILARGKNTGGYLAAGVNFIHDKALSHLQANASVAYHVPITTHSTLGAGLQFGYAQRTLDTENLKWGSQFDGSGYNPTLPAGLPAVRERRGFSDLGAGLVWQYRRGEKYMTGNDQRQITAGLAVFHPHRPDQSFFQTRDRLAVRTVIYSDALFGLSNTDLSLCPSFLFASQGPLTEWTVGLRLRKVFERQSNHTGFLKGKAASIGTAFRLNDAIVPSAFLELGALDIGLSYDINISSLNTASRGRGGMEVSIRYLLSSSDRKSGSSRY